MKAVPIKTQEWIMRIPLVNVANLFICMYNLHAIQIEGKNGNKVFLYLFGYSILYRTCSAIIPVLEPLVHAMGIYLVPLIMGYGLIQFQKKFVFANPENKEEKPL